MNRVYLSIVGVLLALTVALGYSTYSSVGNIAVLREEQRVLLEAQNALNMRREKDRSTLVAREADRRSTGLKLARAEQALSEALERNKTWSDTNVPTEIQDRILGLSDGPAEPVGGMSDLTPGSADN